MYTKNDVITSIFNTPKLLKKRTFREHIPLVNQTALSIQDEAHGYYKLTAIFHLIKIRRKDRKI